MKQYRSRNDLILLDAEVYRQVFRNCNCETHKINQVTIAFI